jgi:hypothetical protein
MQHLSTEDLARLVEEEGDAAEALHLATCGECRTELEALREQVGAMSALPPLRAPSAAWPRLERSLRAEGLLAGGGARRVRFAGPLRIAAALALFAGGGVSGAAMWAARSASGPGSLAAGGPATPGEAAEALRSAEADYLAALARYAELTGTADAVDPVNRLAALEGIVLTARAALREAPADPVINGYLLTALGQREAMLRSISADVDDTWF